MSIKSDKWIRRMAEQHGMIEPFEANQVRESAQGKVISYGTSSYGYDVRCANEFKIFTNINSVIVDPKNFDPNSFVDIQSDVCIIPPNSFALARTVEYFRIPRDVLVVCLGKCLTADTRLVDAETGAYRPITEFSWGHKTLSLDNWQLKPAAISAFVPQGCKPVFAVKTRSGLRIRATANHPFKQLNGWTALEKLKVGDRIAVARSIPIFGKTAIPDWEATLLGLMIAEGQCRTPKHSPVFTTADPVLAELLKITVTESGLGTVTKKANYGYRLVNKAGQGGTPEKNRAYAWLESHNLAVTSEYKFVPQSIFTAPKESVRLFLQALFSGDGGIYKGKNGSFFLEYYSKSRRLIEDVHHLLQRFGIVSLMRDKITSIGTPAHKIQITDREQIIRFHEQIGFYQNSIKQLRLENEIMPLLREQPVRLKSNFDTLPSEAWETVAKVAANHDISLNSLGIKKYPKQSLSYNNLARVAQATQDEELNALLNGVLWDVIESIEPAGEEEVFDLTIPKTHNFVANGFVVHNSTYARCGIIVNVTPLEPEWSGHVTLEFSNTTPLPAKIYANEGVAQMLFFGGDEACETSYKDRGGKYQGQTGVTLPKA